MSHGVSAVLLATLAALTGCSTAVDGEVGRQVGGATPIPSRESADAGRTASASEVSELLNHRAAAIVAGDEARFAATIAEPQSSTGGRQLAGYEAARALGLSRLEVAQPVVNGEHAQVDVRYRLGGLDSADRVARLAYELTRSGSGWMVASERPSGTGATAPWVAMPDLRVQRGEHAVVAGTVADADLTWDPLESTCRHASLSIL